MAEGLRAITRFIELLKSSRLSPSTTVMLEYLLYQLNLAMLRDERLCMESCKFPCEPREIEDLNGLMLAACSEEADCDVTGKELMDRLSQIVDRIHNVDKDLESKKLRRQLEIRIPGTH